MAKLPENLCRILFPQKCLERQGKSSFSAGRQGLFWVFLRKICGALPAIMRRAAGGNHRRPVSDETDFICFFSFSFLLFCHITHREVVIQRVE